MSQNPNESILSEDDLLKMYEEMLKNAKPPELTAIDLQNQGYTDEQIQIADVMKKVSQLITTSDMEKLKIAGFQITAASFGLRSQDPGAALSLDIRMEHSFDYASSLDPDARADHVATFDQLEEQQNQEDLAFTMNFEKQTSSGGTSTATFECWLKDCKSAQDFINKLNFHLNKIIMNDIFITISRTDEKDPGLISFSTFDCGNNEMNISISHGSNSASTMMKETSLAPFCRANGLLLSELVMHMLNTKQQELGISTAEMEFATRVMDKQGARLLPFFFELSSNKLQILDTEKSVLMEITVNTLNQQGTISNNNANFWQSQDQPAATDGPQIQLGSQQ